MVIRQFISTYRSSYYSSVLFLLNKYFQINSPLAPFSGAFNDSESWFESTFSAAHLYDQGVYDTVIPPARFAAANPGMIFAPLANPGHRLILADNITAETLPLPKAFQAQRDAAIAAFALANTNAILRESYGVFAVRDILANQANLEKSYESGAMSNHCALNTKCHTAIATVNRDTISPFMMRFHLLKSVAYLAHYA